MDEKHWHQLHVRVARGEVLSPQESQLYREGLQQREQDELLTRDLSDLMLARQRLSLLETRRTQLTTHYEGLTQQIAHLEKLLDERTQQALTSAA